MVVTIQHLHMAPSSTFRSISRATASISRAAATRRACRVRAMSTEKPPICTADELHFVSVPNCKWRLALWRYNPSQTAPQRTHPLLLLSGVGTNAIGYDLSPESSFARSMSNHGFDTWILEVRGAGLSVEAPNPEALKQSANELSEKVEDAAASVSCDVTSPENQPINNPSALAESNASALKPDLTNMAAVSDESSISTKLTENFMRISEGFSSLSIEDQPNKMSEKLFDQISKLVLESGQNSGVASKIQDLSQRLVNMFPLLDWEEQDTSTTEGFQKQPDLVVKYDWDFDHYLEEDVPAAMEYVRGHCNPKDGKLLAIGHSMGGILLYSMLSRCSHEGKDPKLAAVVTLAASLDYTSSNSTLKLLLPLANPAQAFNLPAVPLGTLLAAAHPLSLPWLVSLITAEDMMHPELLEKLVMNNFCTIPAKLLLQLTTGFQEGGLRDRSGKFSYKDHLHEIKVPVLALAGDQDLICPPEAVEATAKLIPEHLITYQVLGEPGGAHFAHYDLVGGRLAVDQVYPRIIQFLSQHDSS